MFVLGLLLSGCSSWVEDLVRFTDSFPGKVDTLAAAAGGGLVRGIRDTLTAEKSRERLAELLDTLAAHASRSATGAGVSLRDSLLGEYTRRWILDIKDELIGDSTRRRLGAIRDDLLGAKTSLYLNRLIQRDLLGPGTEERIRRIIADGALGAETQARVNALLDDITQNRLAALRDTLIGPVTQSAIDSILARSIARLQKASHEEQDFLTRNASTILWTAGGVVAALLGVGWFLFSRNRNYRSLIDLITYQIHELREDDPVAHEALKRNIQKNAQQRKVEPMLRDILAKQGILGKDVDPPAIAPRSAP